MTQKHDYEAEGIQCQVHEVHSDAVSQAKDFLPEETIIFDLSDFSKLFGDSPRLRILLALDNGEMCVCDISEALGMSMSAVSHQLRILKDAHLIDSRRDGRSIYYRLCDDHVRTVIETALEHVTEEY